MVCWWWSDEQPRGRCESWASTALPASATDRRRQGTADNGQSLPSCAPPSPPTFHQLRRVSHRCISVATICIVYGIRKRGIGTFNSQIQSINQSIVYLLTGYTNSKNMHIQVTSKLDSKDKQWQLPKYKHYHGQVKRQYIKHKHKIVTETQSEQSTLCNDFLKRFNVLKSTTWAGK